MVPPALLIDERFRPFLFLGLRYFYSEEDAGFVTQLPYAGLNMEVQTTNISSDSVTTITSTGKNWKKNKIPSAPHPSPSLPTCCSEGAKQQNNQSEKKLAYARSKNDFSNHKPLNGSQHSTSHVQKSEVWPQPWNTLWSNIGRCRPIVWTYWELGLDISGHADARRRALLQKFNTELSLRPGTNAYWPICAPGENDTLYANKSVFLSGIERIGPQFSVFFGKRILEILEPENPLSPFSTRFFSGCLILALPEIMEMIEDVTLQNKAIAFLRPYFSTLKI